MASIALDCLTQMGQTWTLPQERGELTQPFSTDQTTQPSRGNVLTSRLLPPASGVLLKPPEVLSHPVMS